MMDDEEFANMTPKQRRFCEEYLIDMNATQAAARAGYSKKTAAKIGTENLAKPVIKDYINRRMEEKESELIATQDEVLRYLTSVVRGQSLSEEIVIEGKGDGFSEAKRMKKAPGEKDRLKAAELLGKRYGTFTDKVNLSAEPVEIRNDLKE